MDPWRDLDAELDAWSAAGRTAAFWWRDDDAVDATPALDRLLALRRNLDVPLALAVIPADAGRALADALAGEAGVGRLQHGYAHANHRPAGAKKAELGADRPLWDVARDLADGRSRMIELFGPATEGDGWLEVMVPPWNRIDEAVLGLLPGLGFHGVTTFRARAAAEARPGLAVVNTHVDIIDWDGSRGFVGAAAVVGAAVDHLRAKREGTADAGEATGLLTHHLAHDAACWDFVAAFVARTAAHPAAMWRSAAELFPPPR